MDLLEYQAKDLFQQVGIPILPSQPIDSVAALKRLQIPYPVVLKSQVRAGGRGRAGGIRFVANTIDAIAAAQSIFSLAIQGEYPEVVLAEARYDSQEEIFLAILIDYQLQRPVLLGSTRGGMDVENLLNHLEMVVIEDFSPFYARRLAVKMGLQGQLIQSVSTILEKMYHLLIEKDLDLIEINPLAISASGEVMALDGKITVNDAAIARHIDLQALARNSLASVSPTFPEIDSPLPLPQFLPQGDPNGNIGLIASSFGLALTLWDGIVRDRGKVKQGLVLASGYPPDRFAQQFIQALDQLLSLPRCAAIAIVLIESAETIEAVTITLRDYLATQQRPKTDDRLLRGTGAVLNHRDRSDQLPLRQANGNDLPPITFYSGEGQPLGESLPSLPVVICNNWEQIWQQTVQLSRRA
jgi:succinyl-CoA synthetase beta subunit